MSQENIPSEALTTSSGMRRKATTLVLIGGRLGRNPAEPRGADRARGVATRWKRLGERFDSAQGVFQQS